MNSLGEPPSSVLASEPPTSASSVSNLAPLQKARRSDYAGNSPSSHWQRTGPPTRVGPAHVWFLLGDASGTSDCVPVELTPRS
mmetsp:Transcript_12617/g.34923  ORF Transcript_12617/g.34923 Transcript_12617/m.34923 type:complete len:83 (-) Transcript_12617:235-483(-)